MAQADSKNSITAPVVSTRRHFLTQAAGGAFLGVALPLPGSAGASERVPDPIYAAIEAHKAANAAFIAAVELHGALERELPIEKRRSLLTHWEERIVVTDDTRWIEAERATIRCSAAETDAACVLVSVLPTTMAGVTALLQYAVVIDADGEAWPSHLQTDDESKTYSWHYFLIANLAELLPELAAGRTA